MSQCSARALAHLVFILVTALVAPPAPLAARTRAAPAGLETIHAFVDRHAGRGEVAIFDYDGTLVSEEYRTLLGDVRCGQSAWHVWGAHHLDLLPFLFPKFRTAGGLTAHRQNVLRADDVLEGRTSVDPDAYSKFWQIATFEAGMSPAEMVAGIERFLDDYPPGPYVNWPVLALLRRMQRAGFRVWIVSGSNPYFIATVLRRLERDAARSGRPLPLGGLTGTQFRPGPGGSRIAGNMARLDDAGRFTSVYDDCFVTGGTGVRHVVDGEGKRVVAERVIGPAERSRVVFCAGNSSGDYPLVRWMLETTPDGMALLVNPRAKILGTLTGPRVVRLAVQPGR